MKRKKKKSVRLSSLSSLSLFKLMFNIVIKVVMQSGYARMLGSSHFRKQVFSYPLGT